MPEESYSSSYEEQDDYSATPSSLPYIAKDSEQQSQTASAPSAPQPVQETVILSDIGRLTAIYRPGNVQKIYKNEYEKDLIKGLSFCLLSVPCLLPLIAYVFALQGLGSIRVPIGALRILSMAGIIFFIYGINRITVGINNFVANTLNKNIQYYLCTHGIMRIRGKEVQAIRWDQISIAQKHVRTNPPYTFLQYALHPIDDRAPLVLENIFTSMKSLISNMEYEIVRYYLPKNMEAYRAGQTLDFGAIHVTQQGLRTKDGQKHLPWEKVGYADVWRACLIIKEIGTPLPWADVNISEIYNLCILLPLIKEIKRDNYAKEAASSSLRYQSPVIPVPAPPSEWQEYE